jgi:glycosyltransferase involved in cell wall biosynthesis
MLKVLHIITRIDRGGSAQNTLLTVRGLSEIPGAIHQSRVVQRRSKWSNDRRPEDVDQRREDDIRKYEVVLVTGSVRDMDVRNVNLVIIPELGREINLIGDVVCVFKLCRFIRQGRFDIVHTHSSKGGFLGRIAAKLAGTRKILYTPHGHVFFGYFRPLTTSMFVFLERVAALFTDRIIGLTDNEVSDYIERRISRQDRFLVIHSGVEIERFGGKVNGDRKEALGIPQDVSVVICVARLVPIKGHRYLIDAIGSVVKELPKTRFLFVGDGGLREELEKQVGSLGIGESVLFLGEREDVPELLDCADIFAISSLNEGMGRAIVEAMAAGLPVAGTSVCGIQNVVIDGVTGLLVPPREPEAFASALIRLLKNEQMARHMGEEGKKRAEMYSAVKMVQKIDRLYDKMNSIE